MNIRGLKVFALQEPDGTIWYADEGPDPDVFTCAVGDRTLHIDELTAPPTPATTPTTNRGATTWAASHQSTSP